MSSERNNKTHSISFRRFWTFCASQLGSNALIVRQKANALSSFCDLDGSSSALLKQVINASYKSSRCSDLDSPIDLDLTLDCLGELGFSLAGTHKDDLLDIELLEEIAWCAAQFYAKKRSKKPHQNLGKDDTEGEQCADLEAVNLGRARPDEQNKLSQHKQTHGFSTTTKNDALTPNVYCLKTAKTRKANTQR